MSRSTRRKFPRSRTRAPRAKVGGGAANTGVPRVDVPAKMIYPFACASEPGGPFADDAPVGEPALPAKTLEKWETPKPKVAEEEERPGVVEDESGLDGITTRMVELVSRAEEYAKETELVAREAECLSNVAQKLTPRAYEGSLQDDDGTFVRCEFARILSRHSAVDKKGEGLLPRHEDSELEGILQKIVRAQFDDESAEEADMRKIEKQLRQNEPTGILSEWEEMCKRVPEAVPRDDEFWKRFEEAVEASTECVAQAVVQRAELRKSLCLTMDLLLLWRHREDLRKTESADRSADDHARMLYIQLKLLGDPSLSGPAKRAISNEA